MKENSKWEKTNKFTARAISYVFPVSILHFPCRQIHFEKNYFYSEQLFGVCRDGTEELDIEMKSLSLLETNPVL